MKAIRFLLMCFALAPLAAAQVYTIADLGTLGGRESNAFGINTIGHVAGDSCLDDDCARRHPFLWTVNTGMEDLGTLPGGDVYAGADGVNDLDQVVGLSAFSDPFMGNTHAFLWSATGGMQDLGNLGCPDLTAAASINLVGQVTGTSTVPPCAGGGQSRAFLWTQDGGMQDLGTLPGGMSSTGAAINVVGQVVGGGNCSGCSDAHAFIWDSGIMQDLGVLPGGSYSRAHGVNDLSCVVGESDPAQSGFWIHAFSWSAEQGMRDLGTLDGGMWSYGAAVNDSGQIVGASDSANSRDHGFRRDQMGRPTSTESHAFIWSSHKGMRDLNRLVIPRRTEWLLTDARAINSSGQIAGIGTINGQVHGFLLTPRGHSGRGHGRREGICE